LLLQKWLRGFAGKSSVNNCSKLSLAPPAAFELMNTNRRTSCRLMGSLYLNAGSEGRWLSESEFRQLTGFFIDNTNRGRLCGIRIFRVASLRERPDYVTWTNEALAKLKGA
jgi:hypothetical protein